MSSTGSFEVALCGIRSRKSWVMSSSRSSQLSLWCPYKVSHLLGNHWGYCSRIRFRCCSCTVVKILAHICKGSADKLACTPISQTIKTGCLICAPTCIPCGVWYIFRSSWGNLKPWTSFTSFAKMSIDVSGQEEPSMKSKAERKTSPNRNFACVSNLLLSGCPCRADTHNAQIAPYKQNGGSKFFPGPELQLKKKPCMAKDMP